MKKTKEFNNISDSLLKSVELKKGEIATYRTTAITQNPINPAETLIPSIVTIPSTDQIWDPEKEEFIDIAAVKSVSASGEVTLHEISFYKSQAGHIILNGSIAQDREIHEYMALSNYNKSNEKRDDSKSHYFELVDDNKKSEQERKIRNVKREALNAAADLSVDDVRIHVAALGKDDTRPIDILRNELEILADKDPVAFMELISNSQATISAIINRAIRKSVIIFNIEQSRFEWPNKEVILTVARTSNGEHVSELVGYLVSNAKGEKILQTIQSKTKK